MPPALADAAFDSFAPEDLERLPGVRVGPDAGHERRRHEHRGGDGLIGRLAADLRPRLDRHAGLAGCRQPVDTHDAVDVDASHDQDVGHCPRSSPRICSITRVTLKPSWGDTVAVETSSLAIASSRSLMRMFHSHSRTGSSSTGKVSK